MVMVTDITARKRAEEALREGDERFRAVANQATVGVTRTDLAGRFTFANPRYCEIVGYTQAELLEMRMQDITHAEDLPAISNSSTGSSTGVRISSSRSAISARTDV